MNQNQLDKFDDAFLFTLGSVALIISFIQINMKEVTDIIEAIPFLLLGIVLPFIIGYLKGAIELNHVEERMRGWIYFFIGVISYFAYFTFVRIEGNYYFKETVFILIIVFGAFTTYGFLKWSARIFNIHSASSKYSFSGTALGAVTITLLFRLIIALILDFQGKDLLELIRQSSTELLFWGSILLFVFSIALTCEKASKNALDRRLELPSPPRRFYNFSVVKLAFFTYLGLVFFEHSFDSNLKARLLWLNSFVFWFLGCMFWVAKASLISQVLFMGTIVSCSVAIIFFHTMPLIEYRKVARTRPIKLSYVGLVFVMSTLMVFGGGFQLNLVVVLLIYTLYMIYLQVYRATV
jgi:hypothetical protein